MLDIFHETLLTSAQKTTTKNQPMTTTMVTTRNTNTEPLLQWKSCASTNEGRIAKGSHAVDAAYKEKPALKKSKHDCKPRRF
jgi:hypothetical protein